MIPSRALLLSIRPLFAGAIQDGRKTFEFRRVAPRQTIAGVALIDETAPVGRFTGVVHVTSAQTVIAHTAAALAGPQDSFTSLDEPYLAGARSPCALALARPARFTIPARPSEFTAHTRPPQSLSYVEVDLDAITARAQPGSCRSSASAAAGG